MANAALKASGAVVLIIGAILTLVGLGAIGYAAVNENERRESDPTVFSVFGSGEARREGNLRIAEFGAAAVALGLTSLLSGTLLLVAAGIHGRSIPHRERLEEVTLSAQRTKPLADLLAKRVRRARWQTAITVSLASMILSSGIFATTRYLGILG